MANKLVIVESPAKARTLNRILGRSYSVKASLGHVRDLPKSSLGVDVDNDFTPKYVIPPQKRKIVKELKDAMGKATTIFLATDPDREGEAISWHLVQAANLDKAKDKKTLYRVVFHEITKEAVEEAFKHPGSIDENMVSAQQTRRILDRLVGYKLSPLLWRKVQRGLSAGRVQSVAVRIVVDREQEIQGFNPEEYWIIEVELAPAKEKANTFRAKVTGTGSKTKLVINNEQKAAEVTADLKQAKYSVMSVKAKQASRNPAPPFITSTMQQEASRKLHFPAKRTMAIAQQLYEGLQLGKEGSVGLITYMRTDSTHIAATAMTELRDFIKEKYGKEFLPQKVRYFGKKTKWAQEAHEAIRPTSIYRDPEQLKPFLKPEQFRLYNLVWKRCVASQMSAAIFDNITIDITAEVKAKKSYKLMAASSNLSFPGFIKVYSEGKDEDEDENVVRLPALQAGDKLNYLELFSNQRFTQPPPRYTEATLIKALEQKGIGRPSTYAPILSVIQDRDYVHKLEGKFHADELGIIVTKMLVEHFPQIVDADFTAKMEQNLDEIAQGKRSESSVLADFYSPFEELLQKASTNIVKIDMSKPSDEICDNCGKPMLIKVGRFGKFLACSGYPDCKTTKPYYVKTGSTCPECGHELVERVNKKKQAFYGCISYPQCKFATSDKPLTKSCPECGKLLLQNKKGQVKCNNCKFKTTLAKLEQTDQESETVA